MPMETTTTVTGLTTRLRAMAHTNTSWALNILEIGNRINSTGSELNHGPMALALMELTSMAASTALEYLSGPTDLPTSALST